MKPHRFKGSGPGFPCQYIHGSEREKRRQCSLPIDDPIHVMVEVEQMPDPGKILGKMAEDARVAFGHPLPITPVTEQGQFWPGSAMAVWQGHADVVLALLKRKDGYGDSWVRQGYMGNIGRVLSKADRLRNLLWKDDDQGEARTFGNDESVMDTLYDLSALCALAIANLEEGNRWGH